MITPDQQKKIDEWKKSSGYVPPVQNTNSAFSAIDAKVAALKQQKAMASQPQEPSLVTKYITNPIKEAVKGGINQMGQAQYDSTQGKNPLETGLAYGSGLASAITSPLAPIFAPVSKGIQKVGEAIGNVPAVQKFAETPAGYATSRVAEDVSSAANIAGTVMPLAGGGGVTANLKNVSSKIDNLPQTAIDTAVAVKQSLKNIPVDKFTNAITSIFPEKSKIRASLTNTDPNIFERIKNPQYAESVKNNLASLDEGRSPHMELAQTIGDRINTLEKQAGDNFHAQVNKFVEDNQYTAQSGEKVDGKIIPYKEGASIFPTVDSKINVASKIGDIEKAVSDFGKGNDLHWEQQKTADGKMAGYELTKGRYSPFISTEIRHVNNMIDDIRSAKAINVDELLALDKKLGQYYSLVDDSAGARPYHALVMKIKAKSEGMITDSLPTEMRDAYKAYARIQNMRTEFGNKIVDPKGNIQNGAESFLSNLMGKNKTEMQRKVQTYGKDLGFDPIREAQAISDAKKLHLTEAPTGGRVSDMLKSSLFVGGGAGVGSMVAGPGGAGAGAIMGKMVGARMTSPRLAGEKALSESITQGQKAKAAIKATQKVNANIPKTVPQPKTLSSMLKEPKGGLSMKDVSGVPSTFRADLVAKKMDNAEFLDLQKFLKTPDSLQAYLDISPFLENIGLGKVNAKTQIQKLQDIMREIQNPTGKLPKLNTEKVDPLLSQAQKAVQEGKTMEEFVKAQGTPVYHGSPISGLKEIGFGKGIRGNSFMGKNVETKSPSIFFTENKNTADFFAKDRLDYLKETGKSVSGKGTTYESYIKLKNPLDLTNIKKTDEVLHGLGISVEREILGTEPYSGTGIPLTDLIKNGEIKPDELFTLLDKKEIVDKLKKAGYDGAKALESGNRGISYAVFDPSQIKTRSQLEALYNQAKKAKK